MIDDINQYFVIDGKGVDNGKVNDVLIVLKEYLNDVNNKYYPEAKRLLDKVEKEKNDLKAKQDSLEIEMNTAYDNKDKCEKNITDYSEKIREAKINQGRAANYERFG